MELIKWVIDRCNESPLYVILFWLCIGYFNTFIVRFVYSAPCRFNGDNIEQTNFWEIFLLGPVGLLATPVLFIIEAFLNYKKVTLSNLQKQKKIAKIKPTNEEDQEPSSPPTHLI